MTTNVQQAVGHAAPSLATASAAWLEQQHARGRLSARERVELLLDVGSLTELDTHVAKQDACGDSDGVITVKGSIAGRTVCVFSKDMSIGSGTLGEIHARKICNLQQHALESRVPLIGIFDTAGLRLEDGMNALAGYGAIVRNSVAASGVVPQISLIVGSCPGADALLPPLSDFLFMANDDSSLFVSAPDAVKAVTNEDVDAAALGGAEVHTTVSSLADGSSDNDVLAILKLRRLFAFLPSHNRDAASAWTSFDTVDREAPTLDTLLPHETSTSYDVKELIEQVCDEGDFFELQPDFARNLVIGFARIDGRSVGIVANQCGHLAGVLDGNAACKAARFVRFCDAFGMSVLSFVDTPGFLPGVAQEHGAIAKHVGKLLHAYAQATVPLLTVVLSKAFGAAGTAMGSRAIGADIVYAWPDAQIGLLNAEADVAMRAVQANPSDAIDQARRRLGAKAAVTGGHVDEVITPRQTRMHLARALETLAQKSTPQTPQPWRKHANIPL